MNRKKVRNNRKTFKNAVKKKEIQKIRSKQKQNHNMWFGLGMFGLVGWSIVVPTLIGVGAGIWVDRKWPSQFSWTLMLLFFGLFIGCLNAWYWVSKERKSIERDSKK